MVNPTFTHRLHQTPNHPADWTLSLSAEERTRSRHRFETREGQTVFLQLPRGTVLQDGDWLAAEATDLVLRIQAKPEAVLSIQAATPLDLLRAAYHLGNRHVPLEITPTCLRLAPDPVLRKMLEQLGLEVTEEIHPFN
ncbi:MAG: urease accessory protein UreE [Acaryochloridaceae cyanobacterium CSU_5_19]|nr:urease accessory protein UreE [Acaryochloridaceae cyanobacterium CSU_5_19]